MSKYRVFKKSPQGTRVGVYFKAHRKSVQIFRILNYIMLIIDYLNNNILLSEIIMQ